MNTAIIMDMMFNTEMIVKDMKGGKADMTEKRFTYGLRKGTTMYEIKDSYHEFPIVEPYYYESSAKKVCDLLNEQHETIQQLKAEIKQLNHDLDLYEENNTNEVLNKLRIELTSRMNDCFEEFKE